ncbi:sulfurtransferase complex subunit TusB [Stutzerimonas kirkiae]|uniref:Sulfurtransferase complex subunit TusB n=2 Tax=Stutzerimonas kirkiae TaxID=2211392 RepID=A0A4Q9R7R0_9GAMM|nr:sulfurtransferase complex subunit TusB [Stutzerimonas kirkiae]TBU96066.1 sulfurtransferase complex subunit TusB [Stutzerimonas kirkiae]TBV03102.1 sulfurtransferase complex subunit TusB [Stutzerimonas kirkiae]TBV09814.1 sulfurtransferase complex subunit TusB [Stutzerimonas kirkiae]TBV13456.1 sulfurtransferase complex subunit TusB [Stutzerimonas kirkiae]
MSTLHILSLSPFEGGHLDTCLRLLQGGDALLLCGDAVHALAPGTSRRQVLQRLPRDISLYALAEDIEARSLSDLPERLIAIDYPAFVDICGLYSKSNSWL